MTGECRDPRIGRHLPEYELGIIDDHSLIEFELHLMVCDFCFEQVERFAPAARALRTAEYREMAESGEPGEQPQSFMQQLLDWLFPPGGSWLKPAIGVVVIVLLLPLAWKGLQIGEEPGDMVRPAAEITIVRNRSGAGPASVMVHDGSDLVVRFGFEVSEPGRRVSVMLQGPDGDRLYDDKAFVLDEDYVGWLTVPAYQVIAGEYLLVITDPATPSPLGVDSLTFTVERPDKDSSLD